MISRQTLNIKFNNNEFFFKKQIFIYVNIYHCNQ